jgi:hypothetical protein
MKEAVREAIGTLRCEVCGLDPLVVFGELGESVIECHHLIPLADAAARSGYDPAHLALEGVAVENGETRAVTDAEQPAMVAALDQRMAKP